MLSQLFADFARFITFPAHVVVLVPLGAAAVIHFVRARTARPALVKKGPWEGMPQKGLLEQVGPNLFVLALLAMIIVALGTWSGALPPMRTWLP